MDNDIPDIDPQQFAEDIEKGQEELENMKKLLGIFQGAKELQEDAKRALNSIEKAGNEVTSLVERINRKLGGSDA